MSLSQYLLRAAGSRLLAKGCNTCVMPCRLATAVATATPIEDSVAVHKKDMWDNWGNVYVPDYELEKWPKDFKENEKRDLVNFPHPEHQKFISPVRLGFVPNSWFDFFYNKTGVTGPYMLGWGAVCFIFTKEVVPWEGEWYNMVALLTHIYLINRLFGADIGKYFTENRLNQQIPYANAINEEKDENKQIVEIVSDYAVRVPDLTQYSVAHMKERIAMQMEVAYRERLHQAFLETKRRLDYLAEVEDAKKRMQQKHIVNWVVAQVRKSLTPEKEKLMLAQCIKDLKTLAPK